MADPSGLQKLGKQPQAGSTCARRERNRGRDFGLYAPQPPAIPIAPLHPLTGTANRRAFFERAELEFQRARRQGSAPLSLAYLDLDDFKAVNDRFGHEAGDAVLKMVAATIQDRIRSIDLLARLGGDEFAILLVGADEAQTKVVLDDLRQQLRERLSRSSGNITLSVGVVSLRGEFGSLDEVMAEVDRLMYEAKGRGRSLA